MTVIGRDAQKFPGRVNVLQSRAVVSVLERSPNVNGEKAVRI
jgi:hypothetical protein